MEFSRQERWSGLLFPPPGDLPDPGNWTQMYYPLQYSCLQKSMDSGAWQATSMGSQRAEHVERLNWCFYLSLENCLSYSFAVVQSSVMSYSCDPWTQHARLPCPSLFPRVCSNSCPLSQWCHPAISSSISPFSSCLQAFPASRSFLMSQVFSSGGQNIGVSASASVLPVNVQGWFPLRLTGLISLQSKGLSRIFSNTIVQKHQFFGPQPSL